MRAGRINRVIDIETKTISFDDEGSQQQTWRTWKTMWAEVVRVMPGSGGEEVIAGGVRAPAVYRVSMRWLGSGRIVPGQHRVKVDGRILDIESVDDINEPMRRITVICTEGLTSG